MPVRGSTTPGSIPVPRCPGLTSQLGGNPEVLASAVADAEGIVEYSFGVPAALSGTRTWLHARQVSACSLSPAVVLTW